MSNYKTLMLIGTLILVPNLANAREITPNVVLAGSTVNSWAQGGLKVTDRPFDLAVQGQGFFVLIPSDGDDLIFSRLGSFELDGSGFLIHQDSKAKLVGYDDGKYAPINLSHFARHSFRGSKGIVKQFRVILDGSIEAVYSDGYVIKVANLPLALFQNPRKLDRISTHSFGASDSSGRPSVALGQQDGRGSIYSYSLEELDGIYDPSLDL